MPTTVIFLSLCDDVYRPQVYQTDLEANCCTDVFMAECVTREFVVAQNLEHRNFGMQLSLSTGDIISIVAVKKFKNKT